MKMNVRVLVHRGWDSKEEKMLSAQDLTDLGVRLQPNGRWENLPEHILVMQFVWREDENGVPIFENDIIDVDFETEMGMLRLRGVMGWDANQNGFHLKVASDKAGSGIAKNMKVVGNIFQNEDLLKVPAEIPEVK
jgi:hypothetical protein